MKVDKKTCFSDILPVDSYKLPNMDINLIKPQPKWLSAFHLYNIILENLYFETKMFKAGIYDNFTVKQMI